MGSGTLSINSQSLKQRRRRVALDQNTSAHEAEAVPSKSSARETVARQIAARPYTEGARRSRQLKTTDLIPKRLWAISGLGIVLLLFIVALNGVHYAIPSLEATIGQSVVSSFSLDSSRGLNAWYCNLLLLLTVGASLQIYLLRQHRRDDYRGSYRVWLWFAAIFLAASFESVSSISEVLRDGFQQLAGPGDSSAFWSALILFTALSVLVVRGIVEVRRSRLAVVSLATFFVGYAGTLVLKQLPDLDVRVSGNLQAVHGNLVLIAVSALFFGTMSFARYVYLEANGLIRAGNNIEPRTGKKTTRTKNKKTVKVQKETARKLEQNVAKDRSERQSSNHPEETGIDIKPDTRKVGTASPTSLLSNRLERQSERPDNRVGSGQKLDRQAYSSDSDEDGHSGLSKSGQRRLRKQKRRAA